MQPTDRSAAEIEASLRRGQTSADTERLEAAQEAVDYYLSPRRQAEHLTAQYLPLIDPSGQADWSALPKTIYNITAAMVDTLATLYHDPVRRKFPTAPHFEADWQEDVQGYDGAMQDVDAYTLVAGTVGVRPARMEDGAKMRLLLYPQTMVNIIPGSSDPSVAEVVELFWKYKVAGVETTHRHIWTTEQFIEIVDDVQQNRGQEKHGYGRIPLTFFRNRDARWGFYEEPATDLVLANLTLNKLVTDLNYTVWFQGSALLVTIMGDDSKPVKVGPRRRLNIPDPQGNAFFISPTPNVAAAIEAANLNLKLFLASRRVPEDTFLITRQGESGVAIVARQLSLYEWRKRRINQFRPLEADLLNLINTVREVDSARAIPKVFVPELRYRELKAPLTGEDQTAWDWRIRVGAATVPDYMMSEDPTLTEDGARAKHAENLAYTKANDMEPARRTLAAALEADEARRAAEEEGEEEGERSVAMTCSECGHTWKPRIQTGAPERHCPECGSVRVSAGATLQ